MWQHYSTIPRRPIIGRGKSELDGQWLRDEHENKNEKTTKAVS
jgi:hypothetical protein